MRVTWQAVLLMVGATALWAGHYILAGEALTEITPVGLTFIRWLGAALPLIVIAHLLERPNWSQVLRAWPRLVLLAALGMLAYNLLLYASLSFTTPVGASLVNASSPAVIALLAVLLTRERLSVRRVTGILISFAGVLLIISSGSLATLLSWQINPGYLLMVGAVVAWGLYTIWGRNSAVPPIAATAAQAVISAVALLPFALTEGIHLPTSPLPFWAVIYTIVFPSVGAYVLWNIALRTTPAAVAGIFLNLITVFTVLIGFALGQPVTASDVVGGAVVLAGVTLTSWPARSKNPATMAVAGSSSGG